MITIKRSHFITIIILIVFFESLKFVFAWTGPSVAPPNGNVAAPINVGTVDQIKNAGLGLNGLAVFGNTIMQAASYLNWGATSGSGGYGFRDNNGVIEFRDSGGTWKAVNSLSTASSNTNFTISSNIDNVNLYTLAGSPAASSTYTITINSGVTVGSASTGQAAIVSGNWPAGSTVLLINNGNIYGRGGAGGAGGYSTGAADAGGAGGTALSLSYNITINNTNGNIFGGGGGGGGGSGGYQQYGGFGPISWSGGAGGNGQGSATTGGATGGSAGQNGGGCGSGGAGAAFGLSGAAGTTGSSCGVSGSPGAGGAAGRAISLNGRTVTWLGGNNSTQVKGAVQ